ncbi:hypothetical protein N865_05210 [Intrasporangium oryzae NRRL B-24470]|uniref:DUF3800 domain-containing protein n=1 Tax=Intrasporangium oryzae NRRL B-24470 TaxID=1386089 RepID=W9GBA7_9MICO|nr:DUF3800 domain-containing protein [Intrasporangium oryzae]EWT02487.1 hypothetical protein N865_05210 [Intrasporangium oryzae NRRL B-24470]
MTASTRPSAPVEVACDESGSEGDKLVGGSTDVFAHASLVVDTRTAVETIARIRVEARSPATEVKASVVLREQNRRVLEWLLGPDGPLHGAAHVHLTDKVFHLTTALVRTAAVGDAALARNAMLLGREAVTRIGEDAWLALLGAFNDLVRARTPEDAVRYAAHLREHLRGLAEAARDTAVASLLGRIALGLPAWGAGVGGVVAAREHVLPALDPIVPAVAAVVAFWGAEGRRVQVVHDVQAALTPERVAHIEQMAQSGALAGIRFVDSRTDPRVQLADLLAGAARRIASDALAGRPDPDLAELIRPYVSPSSIWADPVSWELIGPGDLAQRHTGEAAS